VHVGLPGSDDADRPPMLSRGQRLLATLSLDPRPVGATERFFCTPTDAELLTLDSTPNGGSVRILTRKFDHRHRTALRLALLR
jgi:hypothetical protein